MISVQDDHGPALSPGPHPLPTQLEDHETRWSTLPPPWIWIVAGLWFCVSYIIFSHVSFQVCCMGMIHVKVMANEQSQHTWSRRQRLFPLSPLGVRIWPTERGARLSVVVHMCRRENHPNAVSRPLWLEESNQTALGLQLSSKSLLAISSLSNLIWCDSVCSFVIWG